MEDTNTGDSRKKLSEENEDLKKQLKEEFGAIDQWNNPDLPPEMENAFLKQIMDFENAHQNTKYVTVHEYLGFPAWKSVSTLNPDETATELYRILQLMAEQGVMLDTICDVPDEVLYRFITEELFLSEIEDIHIPGYTSHYIYEEFHPNQEHNLLSNATELFRDYLNRENDYYVYLLSQEAKKSRWHKDFRAAFSDFEIAEFEIIHHDYSLETEKGTVDFRCDVKATVEGSGDVFRIRGTGKMYFVYQYDCWCVDKLELPDPVNGL